MFWVPFTCREATKQVLRVSVILDLTIVLPTHFDLEGLILFLPFAL